VGTRYKEDLTEKKIATLSLYFTNRTSKEIKRAIKSFSTIYGYGQPDQWHDAKFPGPKNVGLMVGPGLGSPKIRNREATSSTNF
jgi:hypothetical protein